MAGFKPVNNVGAAENSGKLERVYVDSSHSTIIAPGDVVKYTGTADANGVAAVDVVTGAGTVAGVVDSIDYNISGEALSDTGLAASTAGYVFIRTQPTDVFLVDCDETLAVADVGLNAQPDWVAATKTGGLSISNVQLDSSTKATTATLQFRIIGLAQDDDGVLGNRALVRLNNCSFSNTTGA